MRQVNPEMLYLFSLSQFNKDTLFLHVSYNLSIN